MCLTIYIVQYTQILVIPLSHIHGVVQTVVVDVKQYIVFDETDDSSDKDIYIELNIPVVTNGDYGNVQLHDHTSVNLYTNEQLGFASSSVVVINSDTREDPRQKENSSNAFICRVKEKWLIQEDCEMECCS